MTFRKEDKEKKVKQCTQVHLNPTCLKYTPKPRHKLASRHPIVICRLCLVVSSIVMQLSYFFLCFCFVFELTGITQLLCIPTTGTLHHLSHWHTIQLTAYSYSVYPVLWHPPPSFSLTHNWQHPAIVCTQYYDTPHHLSHWHTIQLTAYSYSVYPALWHTPPFPLTHLHNIIQL